MLFSLFKKIEKSFFSMMVTLANYFIEHITFVKLNLLYFSVTVVVGNCRWSALKIGFALIFALVHTGTCFLNTFYKKPNFILH